VIEGVLFERGSRKMHRASFRALDRVAGVLLQYPTVLARLVGHTDADGTPDGDLDLAQARAEAVKFYLVAKGVSEFRLGAVGVGAGEPMGEGGESAASLLNRRVEFQLRRRD
jgi:outer membrane protein OmpA-like peptidoglycan-associated protein